MRVTLQHRQGSCHIDVEFQSGQNGISALFGPSGAGKSTIINMVAGLQKPDSGSIFIRGRCLFDSAGGINLPPEKRKIGYVFQEALLFPHLSVLGNLLYGQRRGKAGWFSQFGQSRCLSRLRLGGHSGRADCNVNKGADFEQVVNLLGIQDLLSRKPGALSGGEKQRVAFGRAVLSNPDILLMDEPLASLDEARKKEILPFIKNLNAHFNIPILYVSHALEEILVLTRHVIRLEQGKIVEAAFTG